MNEAAKPQPHWGGETDENTPASASKPERKFDILSSWSVMGGKFSQPDRHRLEQIGALDDFSARTVETAYYALELCGLAPSQDQIQTDIERLDDLRSNNPSSPEADEIVDSFLISYAIYDKLWEAYKLCSEYSFTQLTRELKDLTGHTIGYSKADRKHKQPPACLREIGTFYKKHLVGGGVRRHCDGMLRVLLIQQTGKELPKPERLKSVQ